MWTRLLNIFEQFVLNYRMDYIVSTIPELVNELKIAEGKIAKKKGKETTSKETCFYYGQVSHWKKNCKTYKESKKKVACDASSSSCIYVIKVNIVSPDNTWVYDTGCCSYIRIDMKGLRSSRKLTRESLT